MVFLGERAWFFPGRGVRRIRRDTVNERAVRILLECILVYICVYFRAYSVYQNCVMKLDSTCYSNKYFTRPTL